MVKMDDFLSEEQGMELVRLARTTLQHQLGLGQKGEKPVDTALCGYMAAFVTLKKKGQLRGCIGNLEPAGPLWEGVRDNALNAGFHDLRFSPLQQEELIEIEIEVSVLTAPVNLEYTDSRDLLAKLRPGIDGVILSDGRQRATFLPQVWQQLPEPEAFLQHLCRKAGLMPTAWQEDKLTIQVYQVQEFHEK